MYCPYCGRTLPEGAKFCGFCGGKIQEDNRKKESPQWQTQPAYNGTTRRPTREWVSLILCIVLIVMPFLPWVNIQLNGGGELSLLNGADFDNTMFLGIILDDALGNNAADSYYTLAHVYAGLGYVMILMQFIYGVLLLRKRKGLATSIWGNAASLFAFFVAAVYLIPLFMLNLYLADGFYDWYPFNTTYQFTIPPFIALFASITQLILVDRRKPRAV